MSRRPAEKMTEVRIDVSRYPGITEKFKLIMQHYGLRNYIQAVLMMANDYVEKIRRQQRLEQRRRP